MTPPLVLTLALDLASEGFFERERQRWFPPARNLVPAHVTLFHHLPGDGLARIQGDVAAACQAQAPAAFTAEGLRFLGRGVAYVLHMPDVAAFRARLASLWAADLTAQDRQGWRAHVTVQNKASAEAARALHARLLREFAPFGGSVVGVRLWHYLDGPWAEAGSTPFAGP